MRGQGSIPAIIIVIIAGVLFYLLWVQSSTREDILGLNNSLPSEEGSSPVENVTEDNKSLVLSGGVGYVGRRTGKAINSYSLGNVFISYPEVREFVLEKDSVVLSSNVFSSGKLRTVLSGDFSKIGISFNVKRVSGSPVIKVLSGGVELFSERVGEGEFVNLTVSSGRVINNELVVVCAWSGLMFWQEQLCELSGFKILESSFNPVSPRVVKSFSFNSDSEPEDVKISFDVSNSVNVNDLIIRVNDVLVYKARPVNRSASYVVTTTAGTVGLSQGTNLVSFETLDGGEYDLSNVVLTVFEKVLSENSKTFYFNIGEELLNSKNNFVLSVNVDKIIERGGLTIVLNNVFYYLAPEQIAEGVNLINIKKERLVSGANVMRVESSTGRFRIGEVKLEWE